MWITKPIICTETVPFVSSGIDKKNSLACLYTCKDGLTKINNNGGGVQKKFKDLCLQDIGCSFVISFFVNSGAYGACVLCLYGKILKPKFGPHDRVTSLKQKWSNNNNNRSNKVTGYSVFCMKSNTWLRIKVDQYYTSEYNTLSLILGDFSFDGSRGLFFILYLFIFFLYE